MNLRFDNKFNFFTFNEKWKHAGKTPPKPFHKRFG